MRVHRLKKKTNTPANKANRIPKLIHFSEELLIDIKNVSDTLGISSVYLVNMACREFINKVKGK